MGVYNPFWLTCGGRCHIDHLNVRILLFNSNRIYTIPTIVYTSNKHQKKISFTQTIAKTIAEKKMALHCLMGNSCVKLEIWKFKLRNKYKATK